jgi:hypothetical protein
MTTYPDWLEFHTRTIGGPVASVRSRSGVVRLEAGGHDLAERVLVGIPDDDSWAAFAGALEAAGFWEWRADTTHREPHEPGDWYWWLEVREQEGRSHLAAGWNDAPTGFDSVREALLGLVEDVLAEPVA